MPKTIYLNISPTIFFSPNGPHLVGVRVTRGSPVTLTHTSPEVGVLVPPQHDNLIKVSNGQQPNGISARNLYSSNYYLIITLSREHFALCY